MEVIYLPPGKYPTGAVFAVVFALFNLYGADPAISILIAGSIAWRLIHSKHPWSQVLLVGSAEAVGFLFALFIFDLVGGRVSSPLADANWLPLSLIFPVYFAVSRLLIKGNNLIGQQPDSWTKWQLGLDAISQVIFTAYGLLLAEAYRQQGLFGLSLAYVSLLAVVYLMRLHTKLRHANYELKIISEVSQSLNSILRRDKVAEMAALAVDRLTSPGFVAVLLPEGPGNEKMKLSAFVETQYGRPVDNQALENWTKTIIQSATVGQPWLLEGVPGPFGKVMRQVLVPLNLESSFLGLMVVGQSDRSGFSEDDFRSLIIIRSHVVAALANAELYEKTEIMAVTDPMTGLYNYRYLYAKLNEELTKAKRSGGSVSVIYLDVNQFKYYNDSFGHQAGDEVLRQFADLIQESIRQSDIPTRYGGDEFVVILPGTNSEEALEVVKRMKANVDAHSFRIANKNVVIRVSFSAGIAAFPEDASTVDDLIRRADKKMYFDKEAGREVV